MINWRTTALIFPGQGSQEVGMGSDLVAAFPYARAIFAQADEVLGFSLSDLCFNGPAETLNDTLNTQPALFIMGVALVRALSEALGDAFQPACAAGHSLGELTALTAAGALTFEDGLRLVRERGRLMKKAGDLNPGGMAAILKLDDEVVAQICRQVSGEGDGVLQVANYNSPGQVVISGHNAAVERGIELALAAKAKRAIKLPVSIAAHSELMRVVADEFRTAINRTPLNLPEVPVVANITAEPLDSLEAIRAEMEGQLTASVRWTDSVLGMVNQGVTQFIELGPKDVLTGLIKRIAKDVETRSIGKAEDIAAFLAG